MAQHQTPDSLKARVLSVKSRLTGSYMKIAIAAVPELDTAFGGQLIMNCWNLRSSDERLTLAWEAAAGISSEKVEAA